MSTITRENFQCSKRAALIRLHRLRRSSLRKRDKAVRMGDLLEAMRHQIIAVQASCMATQIALSTFNQQSAGEAAQIRKAPTWHAE